MSVRAASSNNTAESKYDVGGKQYDYYCPQLFVFYSCISSTHRPGSDATVGERSMQFQKNSTLTQDLSRRCIATRGESVSTYPRRPKAEAFSNAVDVVERLHDPTDPSTECTRS